MTLNIIGSGLKGISEMSLTTIKVLQESDKILLLSPIEEGLNFLGIKNYESIFGLYKNGEVDTINYKRLLSKVIETSKKYSNVSLILQGHPRLGVTLTSLLESSVKKLGIINVHAGISSFDSMINDLKVDPLERGTQLYDANRLVLFNYTINKFADLFVYHISSVANVKTDYVNPGNTNQLALLKRYLLNTYKPTTSVFIVSSKQDNSGGFIIKSKLSELEKNKRHISYTTSLFIKGEKCKTFNKDFLQLVKK